MAQRSFSEVVTIDGKMGSTRGRIGLIVRGRSGRLAPDRDAGLRMDEGMPDRSGMLERLRLTMQFAQPILGEAGQRLGLVLTSIDLTWLADHLSNAGLPPEAAMTVADRNGAILIRRPDHAEWVGKPLPPAFWPAGGAPPGS